MIKKMLINNGWTQKTFRIKLDYNRLCNFLLFEEVDLKEVDDPKKIYDSVFKYSLDYINSSDDFLKYKIIKYPGRREPKGFLLQDETIENIYKTYEVYKSKMKIKYNRFITVGEFIEFLMFFWCQNNIPTDALNYLDHVSKIEWGFVLEE